MKMRYEILVFVVVPPSFLSAKSPYHNGIVDMQSLGPLFFFFLIQTKFPRFLIRVMCVSLDM
jgi:hypothetical protein